MSTQKPSLGRIIHYRDGVGNVMAGLIHTVHSDTCVSMHVFPPFAAPALAGSRLLEDEPGQLDRWF